MLISDMALLDEIWASYGGYFLACTAVSVAWCFAAFLGLVWFLRVVVPFAWDGLKRLSHWVLSKKQGALYGAALPFWISLPHVHD